MTRIPLLDARRYLEPLDRELHDAFRRVLESGRFVLGPEVERFERSCAEFLGARHAVGVSSGTDALLVALHALEIGPGDEVVVPSFTFFASAAVVVRAGATPVFADCDPRTGLLCAEAVGAALSERTRAVIAVDLFGLPAPVGLIRECVAGRDIAVIEDCAQSFGARDGVPMCGTRGAVGCFSFYPTKNLGAFGDAGLVVTDDDELATWLRRLRIHGMHPRYLHERIGGNFRLDELQAALLSVLLPHVPDWIEQRRENARRWREALAGLPGVYLPPDDPRHTYNQFTIRIRDRDRVRDALEAAGVETEIYYPVPLHRQPCFSGCARLAGALDASERLAQEVLSLPVFPGLTAEEISFAAGVLAEVCADTR